MITLEFKAEFSPEQVLLIEEWLIHSRYIWNRALQKLEEWDKFSGSFGPKEVIDGVKSKEKLYFPCCPVPTSTKSLALKKITDPRNNHKAEDIERDVELYSLNLNPADYELCPYGEKADAYVRVPYTEIVSTEDFKKIREFPRRFKIPTPKEQKDSWGWVPEKPDEYTGHLRYKEDARNPRFYLNEQGQVRLKGEEYRIPLISKPGHQQSQGLGLTVKNENLPEFLREMPSKFRHGVLARLDTAWQEFMKVRFGKATRKVGKPKYKGLRDEIITLEQSSPKQEITFEGDYVCGVPKLTRIVKLPDGTTKKVSARCPGLQKRWFNPPYAVYLNAILPTLLFKINPRFDFDKVKEIKLVPDVCSFRITKKAGKYYIQMTGEIYRSKPVKRSGKAVGLDPGITNEWTLSRSTTDDTDAPRIIERVAQLTPREEKRKIALQRRIAAAEYQRLILLVQNPKVTFEQLNAVVPLTRDSWLAIRTATCEKDIADAIGDVRLNRIKYKAISRSKNVQALYDEIRKIDLKAARRRKAKGEKFASFIVDKFDSIAIEDGTQSQKLKQKGKVSHTAKPLSDIAHGRQIDLIKRQAKKAGKTVVMVSPKNKTKECPVCGLKHEIDLKTRLMNCRCGWVQDIDVSAAVAVELAGFGDMIDSVLSPLAVSVKHSKANKKYVFQTC